jgi:predicted HTH transcriptional regulator
MPSDEIESESLEFKGYRSEQALHNSRELAEEISALANKVGGCIIIGVRSGTEVAHGQWENQLAGIAGADPVSIQERVLGRVQPRIGLVVRIVDFDGKEYIVIEVPHRPDTFVSTASGKTCIREGRSSRPMTPREIESVVKALSTYDWTAEELDADALSLLDSDALNGALEDFRRRREMEFVLEPRSYLESVGATHNGRLTHSGLLFLGRADAIRELIGEHEFRFSWKTRTAGLIINDVWTGCLWNAIGRAHSHFQTCNKSANFKSGDVQFQAPLMDVIAFHEAYLNALVHRDYSSDGMVAVNFTGERLVITSPGVFYGGITPENITRHEPRHRNKALARTLMAHNLVDRAGMGIPRMGIHSLMYGRAFPEFRESSDSVEVSMQAEFLRPPIAALTLENPANWGIPELLVLNLVYEKGFVPAISVEQQLSKFFNESWERLLQVVKQLDQVEFCGTKEGIFIRVTPSWTSFLKVGRLFPAGLISDKHVKLYFYLRRYGEASNADLTDVLGYSYSSQTSQFLRKAKYVRRSGSGPGARWTLIARPVE